jgi:hypothetical protein
MDWNLQNCDTKKPFALYKLIISCTQYSNEKLTNTENWYREQGNLCCYYTPGNVEKSLELVCRRSLEI